MVRSAVDTETCIVRPLRRFYGVLFAPGRRDMEKLPEVLRKLNDASLSQLMRDHETGHLEAHIQRHL